MALDALLLAHHDIQAIVLRAWGRVLVHHFTQVTSKCCTCTSIPLIFGTLVISYLESSLLETHQWSCIALWGSRSGAGTGSGSQDGST